MKEKRKYIPLKDRIPSGAIPFCETTDLTEEEKARLFASDDLFQPSTATRQDSIWASPADQRQTIKQPVKSSPIVEKEDVIPSSVASEPKTPMAAKPGPQMGHGGGLEASRWSSTSQKLAQSKQNSKLNHSDIRAFSNHPQIPPHLRSSNVTLNTQAKATHDLQTFGSMPVSNTIHHLGGSVLASKEMKDMEGNLPSQGTVNGHSSDCNTNTAVTLISTHSQAATETSTMQPVKPSFESRPVVEAKSAVETKLASEDVFLQFLEKKAASSAEAVKKAHAEKELTSAAKQFQVTKAQNSTSTPQPQPQQLSFPTRSRFVPSKGSDDQFQHFLNAKKNALVENGKRYDLAGKQNSSQITTMAQTPESRVGLLQEDVNQIEHVSLFQKVDPHAVFSPRDLPLSVHPSSVVVSKNENFYHNDEVSGGWEVKGLLTDPREMHKTLLADLKEQEKIAPSDLRLTVEALGETTGLTPRKSVNSFEEKISDAGIEQSLKEIVRANQGKDPKESFLDWDGKTWLPPPIDRRSDGGYFDNSFMLKYIREEWEPRVPHGPPVTVDIDCPEFKFGSAPVTNMLLGEQVVQPDTIPDTVNSENEQKRLHQTTNISATVITKRWEKKNKTSQRWAEAHVAHNLAAMSKQREPSPYAPAVECYLRPATATDLKGICEIYNHYVQSPNSIATEDQSPITKEDVMYLLKHAMNEKLPVVVAVRGRMPSPKTQVQGGLSQLNKVTLPQFEGIIGFGLAESFNYGFTSLRTGRSRATANLQFYVHPEYTRKGVGRSLLDRLIQCMSHSYGARDGYDWMNPGDDKVYQVGGAQYWHQLVIQLAVVKGDDPKYEFMKTFLRRYYFNEEGRLRSIIRSSPNEGAAKFADIVFFLKEASQKTEFPPFI